MWGGAFGILLVGIAGHARAGLALALGDAWGGFAEALAYFDARG